jgi:hypothetical protein
MREETKEVLAQIEDRRSLINFKKKPREIYKCAIMFNRRRETRAVFRKAKKWPMAPSGSGF